MATFQTFINTLEYDDLLDLVELSRQPTLIENLNETRNTQISEGVPIVIGTIIPNSYILPIVSGIKVEY